MAWMVGAEAVGVQDIDAVVLGSASQGDVGRGALGEAVA